MVCNLVLLRNHFLWKLELVIQRYSEKFTAFSRKTPVAPILPTLVYGKIAQLSKLRKYLICQESLPKAMVKWFCVKRSSTHLFLAHLARPFLLNQRMKPFCVIRKFLPSKIFGNFLFHSLSFLNTNVNIRNS